MNIKNIIRHSINHLSTHTLDIFFLMLLFILIRTCEYAYISINDIDNFSWSLFLSRSINFDLLFLSLFSMLISVIFLLFSFIHHKSTVLFFRFLYIFLIFIHLAFTHFFLTNNSLLTISVFEFSYQEISQIIGSELSKERIYLWLLYIFIIPLSCIIYFVYIPKINLSKTSKLLLFACLVLVYITSIINRNHTTKSISKFDSKYQYFLGNCKETYFIKSYFDQKYINESNEKIITKQDLRSFQFLFAQNYPNRQFIDETYPFLHNEPYNNVLGPFFKKSPTAPNIVIVICESLSAIYCGPNRLTGNITPFTNELINKSLYWENYLSNTERTYGVLPHLLGSLPTGIGDRGFINMENISTETKQYPKHQTLIQLLKNNNYTTHYFYGGWGYFDKAELFLKKNKIDQFIDESKFDTTKYAKRRKEEKDDLIWGYNDKDLFNQSFDFMQYFNTSKPFLSIYQTISMHSPFNLATNQYYKPSFLKPYINSKNKHFKNSELSSILFADDALKLFFEKFSKRPDYQNTIFIIVGDHSLAFNIRKDPLEEFHVPLIIYSPLLTKNAKFKGMCSHIDVLPSLLALLEGNFNLKFPISKHWIGEGLDTSSTFNANRCIPLLINSTKLPNIIINNNLVFNNEVFKIEENFKITPSESVNINQSVLEQLNNYRLLNNYTCQKNRITP